MMPAMMGTVLALVLLQAPGLVAAASIGSVVEADLDAVAFVRDAIGGDATGTTNAAAATLLLRALPRLSTPLQVHVSSPTAPSGWHSRAVTVIPSHDVSRSAAPVSRLVIPLAGWRDGDHVLRLGAFQPPHVASTARWCAGCAWQRHHPSPPRRTLL